MIDWLHKLIHELDAGRSLVRVVLAEARGSTPQDFGAVMLVGPDRIMGTIGGGELEWRAIARARELLRGESVAAQIERWPLGPELGQCCGGSVRLWFERIAPADRAIFADLFGRMSHGTTVWLRSELHPPGGSEFRSRVETQTISGGTVDRRIVSDPPTDENALMLIERIALDATPVWIFGAGHVGCALAAVLEKLPFQVTVVDGRSEWLARVSGDVHRRLAAEHPDRLAGEIPSGAAVIIMTHSHEIDYAVCRRALERSDLLWTGLIGSETKATCFRIRLARDGLADEAIARLHSPIGVAGLRSKDPQVIAVSVAAQLLQQGQAALSACRVKSGSNTLSAST